MGKFIVRSTEAGFSFTLLANNHLVIGVSEVYTTKANCLLGVESVRKNSVSAVEDQTVTGAAVLPCPKYEIFTDKGEKFRFRLRAKNGEIILASQGYTTKANCIKGVNSVKTNAPDATVEGAV